MASNIRIAIASAILSASCAYAQHGPPPAAPVSVAPVVEAEVSGQIQLIGRVEPLRSSTVAADVAGIVREVHFKDGDTLKMGDLLIQQDTALPTLEKLSADAAHAAAVAAWSESSNALVRATALHGSRQISDADFETTTATEHRLRFQAAEADARRQQANIRLKRTATHMPYDGTVTMKHVDVGEWLPAGGAVAGVVDLSSVYAVLDLPETRIDDVDRDADVILRVDGREQTYVGRVDAIIPAADPEAHTVPLRVLYVNLGNKLIAGMYINASVSTSDRSRALLVPKDAIVRSGGKASLYVVIDNKPVPVNVQTGTAHADHIVVRGELEAGQQVVVRGNERIRPGMSVEVTETLETFEHP